VQASVVPTLSQKTRKDGAPSDELAQAPKLQNPFNATAHQLPE
jgi:hypothetical protein